MSSDKSRIELHFFYVVVLLVFCLVLTATDRWTDKANFTEYLTNVATMVSVVLALVAIFYSFISNVGLSRSLGNIERVSEEIGATRSAMEGFISESKAIVAAGQKNAGDLRTVSEQVSTNIGSLEETLAALRVENAELRDSLVPIPGRIDQIYARLAESIPAITPPAMQKGDSSFGLHSKNYLKRSSMWGVCIMYAMTLAYQTNRNIEIKTLTALIGGTDGYVYGYLVALHGIDFALLQTIESAPETFKVTRLGEFLSSLNEEQVRAELNGRPGPEESIKMVEKIKQLFSN